MDGSPPASARAVPWPSSPGSVSGPVSGSRSRWAGGAHRSASPAASVPVPPAAPGPAPAPTSAPGPAPARDRDPRRWRSSDECLQLARPGSRCRRPECGTRAAWQTYASPGSGRASLEERAVVGFTPRDDGGGEPAPAHLGEQVRAVAGDHDLVARRSTWAAPPPGRPSAAGCRSRSGRARATRALDAASSSRGSSAKAPARNERGDGDGVGRPGRPRRGTPWAGRPAPRRRAPVVKKPPDASSQNRSSSWVAACDARSRHTCPAGPFGQADAGLGQPGVVRRRRPDGAPARPASCASAARRRTWRSSRNSPISSARRP